MDPQPGSRAESDPEVLRDGNQLTDRTLERDSSKSINGRQKRMRTGIILVDHGSRRSMHVMLEELAGIFAKRFAEKYRSSNRRTWRSRAVIASAYAKCVERGASASSLPYFLGPGKHWTQDIPRYRRTAGAIPPNAVSRHANARH